MNWGIRRVQTRDRGNGTVAKRCTYITWLGGWTRSRKKAHSFPSKAAAELALGSRPGEVFEL